MATSNKQSSPNQCTLCKQTSFRCFTLIQNIGTQERDFINRFIESTLSDEACVCQPCMKQIKKNSKTADENFRPRWLPKLFPTRTPCCIKNCGGVAFSATNLMTPDELEQELEVTVVAFVVDECETQLSLCRRHYNEMYRKFKVTAKPCDSCDAKPRKGEHFTRHCPDPQTINSHFQTITGDQKSLSHESNICLPCYKYFKSIAKGAAAEDDSSLDCAYSKIANRKLLLTSEVVSMTMNEYFELSACLVAEKLADAFRNDEARLLPSVHRHFIDTVHTNPTNCPILESINPKHIPGTRWLLSRLHSFFGSGLEVQCKHKRFGSLLFNKHCDLIKALSSALGRGQPAPTSTTAHSVPTATIDSMATHLNAKLHDQAKALTAEYKFDPSKFSSLALRHLVSSLDPSLVRFIQKLTSGRSKRHWEVHDDCTSEDDQHKGMSIKEIRQVYALCVLLFCTDNTCSMPLHILLTEAILCHGGSLELVRILNRVGAVASLDTCNRLATYVVEERIRTGIEPELVPNKLIIVSIDNIDILQLHAMVSSLDDTRSWHGTSVQCVQPLPLSGTLSQSEKLQPTSRKHAATTSPALVEKHKRRRRTISEQTSPHTQVAAIPTGILSCDTDNLKDIDASDYTSSSSGLALSSFHTSQKEQTGLSSLHNGIFRCILLKEVQSSQEKVTLPGIPSLLNCVQQLTDESEVSNVVYVDILSEKADSKSTLLKVIGNLYHTFVKQLNQKYVLVVGDAKTYDLLYSICMEYGSHLNWLLPFPGDWHILFNYQKVLMKAYSDAGLVELAKESGHRAETLTTLIQCSNFRRTHNFLLQAHEAFYRFFLSLFNAKEPRASNEDILTLLTGVISKFSALKSDDMLGEFRDSAEEVFTHSLFCFTGFTDFMKDLSEKQSTIKFWYNFIMKDSFAYVALYIAIRYRLWDLRVGSLKLMAPIFQAFDRPTYQRLIPRHLKDLATFPECVLHHLEAGGFSVRLTPSNWHAVALDECHEMKINKDAKLAVVRPNPQRMAHISNHMPFRARCMNNLTAQLFPEQDKQPGFSHKPTSKDLIATANADRMTLLLKGHGMFNQLPENQGLWNFLREVRATTEQEHDLMNFREIGQASFDLYVQFKMLKESTAKAPVHKKRLCTFTVTKSQKQRVKQVEKERKLQTRLLKHQISFISKNGADSSALSNFYGQISPLPRALLDSKSDLPHKASKSSATTYLERRYKDVVSSRLPAQWIPEVVILEGMFVIQTSPIPTLTSMRDYVNLLLAKYVQPHFQAGAMQVHVVFDNPGSLSITPKVIEHRRRDQKETSTSHKCAEMTSEEPIPLAWRELLSCRVCKKNLTRFVAKEMLHLIPSSLRRNQTFTTNIGETAYSVGSNKVVYPEPVLRTNADEGDMRVWLHCINTPGQRKLIFSPDTDVYHIGLTLMSQVDPEGVVFIQLSTNYTGDARFLNMNALISAMSGDYALSTVPQVLLPQSLQTLYVCTGCDYVSFFQGIGKVSFLHTFFRFASFINDEQLLGSLGRMVADPNSPSFYAFLRLVGCAYFKTHSSAFQQSSPVTLYNSVESASIQQQHVQWLDMIRRTVWLRAESERQTMPSVEALRLHWNRSQWVVEMWHNAPSNDIELPELSSYGWMLEEGKLQVIWDVPENIAKVGERLEFVLTGCSCKVTGCSNKRCKCVKTNRKCGPSCRCVNCFNIETSSQDIEVELNEVEADDRREENLQDEDLVEDIDSNDEELPE